jgi:hypothetical protein
VRASQNVMARSFLESNVDDRCVLTREVGLLREQLNRARHAFKRKRRRFTNRADQEGHWSLLPKLNIHIYMEE